MPVIAVLILALAVSVHSVGQEAATGFPRGVGGLNLVGESTDNMVSGTNLHLGEPPARALVPAHATMGRGGAHESGNVLTVPGLRYGSQIRATAVQPVPVDVVPLNRVVGGRQSQQRSMKQDSMTAPVALLFTHGIPVLVHVPAPLSDPSSISLVNKGMGAERPFMSLEGDERSQAVFAEFDGMRSHVTGSQTARRRAVVSDADPVWLPGQLRSAVVAGARDSRTRTEDSSLFGEVVAPHRAEQSLARIYGADAGEKVCAALAADTRDGTLWLHREASLPGVGPGRLQPRRGMSVPQFYHEWRHSLG